MTKWSKFGERFTRPTGARQLMDDLGDALSGDRSICMLGGGNPAHIPELEDAGTQTFNGACVYEPPLNPEITSWGTPGPNTCVSTHFTVFPSEHG